MHLPKGKNKEGFRLQLVVTHNQPQVRWLAQAGELLRGQPTHQGVHQGVKKKGKYPICLKWENIIFIYICIHTYTHTHIYTHIYIYIYIYTHIHIHTHTHIHKAIRQVAKHCYGKIFRMWRNLKEKIMKSSRTLL